MAVISSKHHGMELDSSYFTAVYLCVSALLLMLGGLLFYVLCSRRYKLNWFERDQLDKVAHDVGKKELSQLSIVTESAVSDITESLKDSTGKTMAPQSQVVSGNLGVGSNGKSKFLRSHSSGRLESSSSQESGHFWVPPSLQRQASVCQSDAPTDLSGDDVSLPGTPNTPLGIKLSPFTTPSPASIGGQSDKFGSSGQLVKYVQPQSAVINRPKVTSMYSRLDHTKINAAMYNKDGSPPITPDTAPRGAVHFAVSYNRELSILCVHLIQMIDLIPREFSGSADPYAKIRVLPDKKTFRQSTIHRKTLNPTFDEEFVFDMPPATESSTPTTATTATTGETGVNGVKDQGCVTRVKNGRVVEILIFDYDEYSRHHCLGYVQLSLDGINLTSEKIPFWKAIVPLDEAVDQFHEWGQIMFSLGYLPSAERLTVVVMKARDLKPVDEVKKTSDCYVKVALSIDNKKVKKKKTSTQRGTLNPVFNEALTFNVSKENLKSISWEVSVVNDNMLGQNEVLGRVLVGHDCPEDESLHVQSMIASKTAIAMWHNLNAPPASEKNS